ncbi:DUF3144 domain-containing protein [Thiobacillus sp.]|uniref:DUF3144 domain-containing protein n=1 Tax=Thiobacillus sp. TaxID=924 RepID=UPI0025F40132|nr:DUF3144 domain-containing protein [Thiobacillus sp.]
MSDVLRDKQFWDMTDSFIQLANTHLNEVKPSRVSACALFAASRFNAFVITAASESKEQLIAEKRLRSLISSTNTKKCCARTWMSIWRATTSTAVNWQEMDRALSF